MATGRVTAKSAQIAPQDVYRVLDALQEKGLVEKIVAKPSMYKSTPINEGLSILLQTKRQEYVETEKNVEILRSTFCENQEKGSQGCVQFVITSQLTLLWKLHAKLANASKKSIDFIAPLKTSEQKLHRCCPYIKPAISRNVNIRVIVAKGGETPKFSKVVKNPLFQLRLLPEGAIPFGMHIFDRQEVTLAISKEPLPSLWSNNAHLVRLAEVYYESMWNSATEEIGWIQREKKPTSL